MVFVAYFGSSVALVVIKDLFWHAFFEALLQMVATISPRLNWSSSYHKLYNINPRITNTSQVRRVTTTNFALQRD